MNLDSVNNVAAGKNVHVRFLSAAGTGDQAISLASQDSSVACSTQADSRLSMVSANKKTVAALERTAIMVDLIMSFLLASER